jgi:predicted N-acetyltransferase YhbS
VLPIHHDDFAFSDEPTRLKCRHHIGGPAFSLSCSFGKLSSLSQIFAAQATDFPEIDTLLDARFGPARRNRTAYRLRDGAAMDADLSFVLRDAERLVGSVQCWPIALRGAAGSSQPLVLLGPVAVAADREGEGLASALVRAALAAADALGRPPILLIGDAPFYGRFGFGAAAAAAWQLPGPVDRARLLLRGAAAGLPRLGCVEPSTPTRRAA